MNINLIIVQPDGKNVEIPTPFPEVPRPGDLIEDSTGSEDRSYRVLDACRRWETKYILGNPRIIVYLPAELVVEEVSHDEPEPTAAKPEPTAARPRKKGKGGRRS